MEGNEQLTTRSSRVKAARKLTRRASRMSARRFLVEGPQAVREALVLPECVVELFATYDAGVRHPELRRAATGMGLSWWDVEPDVVAALSETVTPQGIVAVCDFLDVPLTQSVTESVRLVTICSNVRDPGNVGTVIRCADAAGADAVVLAGTSVDAYNGKAVRASVGSVFHLPLTFGVTVADSVRHAQSAGLTVLAADGGAQLTLDDALGTGLLDRPTAWLFGNEAWGLPADDVALADQVVRIPIYGRAESLNLGAAAAVCLYASARAQRARSAE